MIYNYLKTAIRSFLRNRMSSTVNLLGLTTGIVACLLIVQYVQQQLSFDDFHEDALYRVSLIETEGNSQDRSASNYYGVPETLTEELPEVLSFCTLHEHSGVMRYADVKYKENRMYYADPNFLDFFSYPLIKGDKATALKSPNELLITVEAALKYFGNEDPIGKNMEINGAENYVVAGVVGSPDNSHFRFDFILNNEHLVQDWYRVDDKIWNWSNFYSYLKLDPTADVASLEAKFPIILDPHIESEGLAWNNFLQPIDEITLYSDLDWELSPTGHGRIIYTLLIIAFLILTIAWVNYVNLSTAQATERAKEVGIRKVSGATRGQLVWQFLFQSFLLNAVAFGLAIIICSAIAPAFEMLVGGSIVPLGYLLFHNKFLILGLFLLGGLASGLYPAAVLSGFKPVQVLKGRFISTGHGLVLRKGLAIFQFTTSIVLIAGTIMIYKQLQYMRNQQLGFDPTQKLVVEGPSLTDDTYTAQFSSFKNIISDHAHINAVATSSTVPGKNMSGIYSGFRRPEVSPDQSILMEIMNIDDQFVPTYGISLRAGRNFQRSQDRNDKRILLNNSGALALGFASAKAAVDKQVVIGTGGDNTFQVVGVLDDHHHQSLKEQIEPLCVFFQPENKRYYTIGISNTDLQQTLAFVIESFELAFPGNPVEYFFVDASFNAQYEADGRLGNIILLFSSLAIFIACLGLFGLTSFTAIKKAKEIGVRKILGANTADILKLMSKEFIGVLLISMALAIPLSIFAIQKWLENYAYQTDMEWWVFAVAGLVSLLVAIITMSYQSLRAAFSHPVHALREE